MQNPPQSNLKFLPIGVLITAALIATAYFLGSPAPHLPVISQVRPFQLTNQLAQRITLDSLKGRVWVANIIFTRCPGPCLKMTQQMAELVHAMRDQPKVSFVSLTTDPDFDTPEVLKRYSQKVAANPERWRFLTGSKTEIARLAVEDLKLTAVETRPEERSNPEDLFVHSTLSVIVDTRGRVRAVVEALEPEGLTQLQTLLKNLLSE